MLKMFSEAMREAGLGYGFYFSHPNNFYLNTFDHSTRPAPTLLPGQANVTQQGFLPGQANATQQGFEDTSISLMFATA